MQKVSLLPAQEIGGRNVHLSQETKAEPAHTYHKETSHKRHNGHQVAVSNFLGDPLRPSCEALIFTDLSFEKFTGEVPRAPGNGARLGALTLLKTLTFNARATCKVSLNSDSVTTDQVVAKGVTINSGALVSVCDLGTTILTSGTVFTIINNTATTAIAGTFSNQADGSTITVGSNTYLVSYEGGTGNDLTLTVQ